MLLSRMNVPPVTGSVVQQSSSPCGPQVAGRPVHPGIGTTPVPLLVLVVVLLPLFPPAPLALAGAPPAPGALDASW